MLKVHTKTYTFPESSLRHYSNELINISNRCKRVIKPLASNNELFTVESKISYYFLLLRL